MATRAGMGARPRDASRHVWLHRLSVPQQAPFVSALRTAQQHGDKPSGDSGAERRAQAHAHPWSGRGRCPAGTGTWPPAPGWPARLEAIAHAVSNKQQNGILCIKRSLASSFWMACRSGGGTGAQDPSWVGHPLRTLAELPSSGTLHTKVHRAACGNPCPTTVPGMDGGMHWPHSLRSLRRASCILLRGTSCIRLFQRHSRLTPSNSHVVASSVATWKATAVASISRSSRLHSPVESRRMVSKALGRMQGGG